MDEGFEINTGTIFQDIHSDWQKFDRNFLIRSKIIVTVIPTPIKLKIIVQNNSKFILRLRDTRFIFKLGKELAVLR